jgi:hypothetical protein
MPCAPSPPRCMSTCCCSHPSRGSHAPNLCCVSAPPRRAFPRTTPSPTCDRAEGDPGTQRLPPPAPRPEPHPGHSPAAPAVAAHPVLAGEVWAWVPTMASLRRCRRTWYPLCVPCALRCWMTRVRWLRCCRLHGVGASPHRRQMRWACRSVLESGCVYTPPACHVWKVSPCAMWGHAWMLLGMLVLWMAEYCAGDIHRAATVVAACCVSRSPQGGQRNARRCEGRGGRLQPQGTSSSPSSSCVRHLNPAD